LLFLLKDLTPIQYGLTVAALYIAGVFICHQTAKDNDETDPGYIVFDEIVGFLVAMFLVPITWGWIAIGFIIFRFFDILKPPPIKAMEKNRGIGMAIMLDDVIAGLYTLIIIHFILIPIL
jgi:phosphatidylglycerophosphatase A